MRVPLQNHRKSSTTQPDQAGFRDGAVTAKVRALGFLVGLAFFVPGALFCWFGAIKPITSVVQSGAWPQVPCRIVSSDVERNHGKDGDTFKVAITFAYTFDGQSYTGGSYDFNAMSSSGYGGKAAIVDRFPVGHETECWVNPEDPSIAVLSRKVAPLVYFILPFTGLFLFLGGMIMLGSLNLLPRKWSVKLSRHQRIAEEDRKETTLKPSSGPITKLAGTVFFAVVWNGALFLFLQDVVANFRQGDFNWFLLIILIPFGGIGIGAAVGVGYFILALANPKVRLTLDEGSPRLGDSVRLSWILSGSIHRLQNLTIALEGRELATYRRGTRTTTDRSLFHQTTIFQTDEPLAHRTGLVSFSVPADQMHTFTSKNNRIEWSIRVSGAIHRWPDVNQTYPIDVRPMLAPHLTPA